MKKKIFCLLLAAIMMLLSLPLSAFAEQISNIEPEGEKSEVDSSLPIVSITAVKTYSSEDSAYMFNGDPTSPYAKPDSNDIIYLTISANKKPTKDITVYYRTVDGSAIAETGDYIAIPYGTSVTLTSTEYSKTIAISTKKSKFALRTVDVTGRTYGYRYESRSFFVEITSVEGGGNISPENKSVECALAAEHLLDNDNGTLLAYKQGNMVKTGNLLNRQADEDQLRYGSWTSYFSLAFPGHWQKDFTSTGLAYPYIGISNGHIKESLLWDSSCEVTLNLDYQKPGTNTYAAGFELRLKGPFNNDDYISWSQAFSHWLLGVNNAPSNEKSWKGKWKDFAENNFKSITVPTSVGQRKISRPGFLDAVNNGLVVPSNIFGGGDNYYVVRMPRDFIESSSFRYKFESYGGFYRRTTSGAFTVGIIDSDAPEIVTNADYKYCVYSNLNTVKFGDKLKIMVRFKEPVYVDMRDSARPYVTANVVKGINYDTLKFDYAGGSGTDTLYFEAEYEGDNLIKVIDNIYLNNCHIYDYSEKNNKFSRSSVKLGSVGGYVDMSDPTVSINRENTNGKYEKSADVVVTVGNLRGEASLFYAWVDTEDEIPTSYSKATLTDYVAKIRGDGDGEKYLRLKVITAYGKVRETGPYGPYLFDNKPPDIPDECNPYDSEIGRENFFTDGMMEKVYTIPIPKDEGSGFKRIELVEINWVISEENTVEFKNDIIAYYDIDGSKKGNVEKSEDGKNIVFTVTPEDTSEKDNFEEGGEPYRTDVVFAWNVYDSLGNNYSPLYDNLIDGERNATKLHSVTFDSHTYLDVKYTQPNDTDGNYSIYHLQENENMIKMGGTINNVPAGIEIDKFIASVTRNSDSGTTPPTSEFKVSNVTNNTGGETFNCDFEVTLKDNLRAGYYDIVFENDTMQSKPFRLYVTTGNDTSTFSESLKNGTLLTNKVYQLAPGAALEYQDSEGVLQKELYTEDLDKSKPMTFSSKDKAHNYVMFREYEDIMAVEINDTQALYLNTPNIDAYTRANGEAREAKAGEVWIRYKSAEWTPGSNKRVWYFYSESRTSEAVTVDIDKLSENLKRSINSVKDTIVSKGSEVFLTGAYLDKNGVPFLAPKQISETPIVLATTKTGNDISPDKNLEKDVNIYDSKVLIGENEYSIAGNATLSGSEKYRYQYQKNTNLLGTGWTDILVPSYMPNITLSDAIEESGLYVIRELGPDGVTETTVYIDKDAPKLRINTDSNTPIELSSTNDKMEYRMKKCYISGILGDEIDRSSYVAIYSYSDSYFNGKLLSVHTAKDLEEEMVVLEDGNYRLIVSDRSGNSYSVALRVDSSELICSVTEKANSYIRFSCNRPSKQIESFTVYKNGEKARYEEGHTNAGQLINEYEPDMRFTESGVYTFYVRDIFGNEYTYTVTFSRNFPEVAWKYYSEEAQRKVEYDPTKADDINEFKLVPVSDGNFRISTSVEITFILPSEYSYEISGIDEQFVKDPQSGQVTIAKGNSFQLKVYYTKHPDVYTIYTCSADSTPPTVVVYTEKDILVGDEKEMLLEEAAKAKEGAILPLPAISFALSEQGKEVYYLSNGETVFSDLIRLDVSDSSGVASLEIYLDEKLIVSRNAIDGFSGIVLSKIGDYKIIAKDILANTTEFVFKNRTPSGVKHIIDGKEIPLELHAYKNFVVGDDGSKTYTKTTYGNSYTAIRFSEDADLFYEIVDAYGYVNRFAFRVRDGLISSLAYMRPKPDENQQVDEGVVVELTVQSALLDRSNQNINIGEEYALLSDEERYGFNIYASIAENKDIIIKLKAAKNANDVFKVDARIVNTAEDFFYFSTELSGKHSTLVFKDGDGKLLNSQNVSDELKAGASFTVDTAEFDKQKIAKVEVYHSTLNDIAANYSDESANLYEDGKKYTEVGFYLIRATNYYGNETVYRLVLSDSFPISYRVELEDGYVFNYSLNNVEKLYSNKKVVIEAHSLNVTVSALKNGEKCEPSVKIENGVTYITVDSDGAYKLTLTNEYGMTVSIEAEVSTKKATFNEELLVGYNEKALRRDEGYTNQVLSVNKEIFAAEKLYYMAVEYNGELTVLYDNISESKIELDEKLFDKIIGAKGDGVYEVIFRNKYGALASKTIHYRSTPTLTLSRYTMNSTELELYGLDKALEIGFWSNNTLTFVSEAEVYTFTVNGSKSDCPITLSFQDMSGEGNLEYAITYIDEYGFEYTFNAYLLRQELHVTPDEGLNAVYIGSMFTTQDDIVMTFSENATCTYSLDGAEPVPYEKGTALKRDGTYRFIVSDYAGNVATISLKKDTMVDFAMVEVEKSLTLPNGGVANTDKVELEILNSDRVYIEKVFCNGVEFKDYDDRSFKGDGKWEVLLRDEIGNKAYFSFYIITHARKAFSYTTPFDYKIEELWYDNGEGIKTSYMQFINHTDFNSNFSFDENGEYTVVLKSQTTGSKMTFEFIINKTAPAVSLVGCSEGEVTMNDVTLKGCNVGDVIRVYRATKLGEELVSETVVTNKTIEMPVIKEGGKYRIVVENDAGVATELTFERKHVMNVAGSIFIIVMVFIIIIALFVGLMYRNKSKTDK